MFPGVSGDDKPGGASEVSEDLAFHVSVSEERPVLARALKERLRAKLLA